MKCHWLWTVSIFVRRRRTNDKQWQSILRVRVCCAVRVSDDGGCFLTTSRVHLKRGRSRLWKQCLAEPMAHDWWRNFCIASQLKRMRRKKNGFSVQMKTRCMSFHHFPMAANIFFSLCFLMNKSLCPRPKRFLVCAKIFFFFGFRYFYDWWKTLWLRFQTFFCPMRGRRKSIYWIILAYLILFWFFCNKREHSFCFSSLFPHRQHDKHSTN